MIGVNCIIFSILIVGTNGYHYNNYPYSTSWPEAPLYPAHCCPLEWINMTQGEELPKDWILGGTFNGKNYAITRSSDPDGAAFKPSEKSEATYTHWGTVPDPFPILSNPNKCHIGWKSMPSNEEVVSNNEIFYPSTGYSKYGAYVRYQGSPGWMHSGGDIYRMTSSTSSETVSGATVDKLYVDCGKSFDSMFNLQLVDLSFNQLDVDNLASFSHHKTYATKTFINNNEQTSRAEINFSTQTSKSLNMTLNSNPNFRLNFNDDSYHNWISKETILNLLSDVGFHEFEYEPSKLWTSRTNVTQIFGANHQRMSPFKRRIPLPGNTKVTVTAISDSIRGQVPFRAIYKFVPIKAGDNLVTNWMLKQTMMLRYRFKEMSIFDDDAADGPLLVTLDGVMDIDAGSDIYLEIKNEEIRDNMSVSTGNPINDPKVTIQYMY